MVCDRSLHAEREAHDAKGVILGGRCCAFGHHAHGGDACESATHEQWQLLLQSQMAHTSKILAPVSFSSCLLAPHAAVAACLRLPQGPSWPDTITWL